MNQNKIEQLLKLQASVGMRVAIDPYASTVARILTRPSWLHPISRARFNRQFESRVQLVLAENAKALLEEIGTKQQ
ncbi:MAG: hypothetical protein ACOH18_05425 [Candidatus Saccharimonadaceae bacterium]